MTPIFQPSSTAAGLHSRRAFLKRNAALAAFTGSPIAGLLAALGAQAQVSQNSSEDFKALVCVFLLGGNDQSNLIVPTDASPYAAYRSARPDIAQTQASLLPISPLGYTGPALGFAPQMAGLQGLFNEQHCAIVANVGTLVAPINRAEWNNGSPTVAVPAQLFSHSDQQGAWQTGIPDRASQTGWLGRMGDILVPAMQASSPLSICVSTGGDNMIQVGESVIQYQITTDGAVRVNQLDDLFGDNAAGGAALKSILTTGTSHLMEAQFAGIAKRAIDNEGLVNTALASAAVATPFADNALGKQLKMVARMIKARASFGHKRQIYFVSMGGFDFHDNVLAEQAPRLQVLSDELKSFYDATVELGIARNVTSFTASEFGRALQSNGRGSDHGWGGHQFVVGGAVQGKRVVGQFPTVALGSADDAGNGILLPTTALDQMAGNLATWFGVPASGLSDVLPNIGRFAGSDIGLFAG